MSPKLYKLYTNDIPHLPDIFLTQFADNTAFLLRHTQSPLNVFKKTPGLPKYLFVLAQEMKN